MQEQQQLASVNDETLNYEPFILDKFSQGNNDSADIR
jgi:hypothetical protein